jgi:modulator of FtsH protease HflC
MMKTAAIVIVILFIVLVQSVFVIPEGQQALIFQFGRHVRTIQAAGLYFKIPFLQNVNRLSYKVLAAEARPAEYITLDKKRLVVDTVGRWKIEDPLVFYQSVRDDQGAIDRLNDIIFARVRQEIGNHNFISIIREDRESIMKLVTKGSAEQAKRFGIKVLDVRIRRVDLPEEVQASVFARMKAERERIAKRYRAEGEEQAKQLMANANKEREILLAEAYKQSETLRGQGDADATSIYSASYGRDQEFYSFLKHMDVYKKVLSKDTSIVLDPKSDFLQYMSDPVAEAAKSQAVK